MHSASSDPLLDAQSAMNRSTRGQWQMYASHRAHLERLITPAEPGAGSACVLGAGNCNDLDLNWMAQVYREVHLADLDRDALSAGVAKQKVRHGDAIHLHAPIDLTGIAPQIAAWHVTKPSEEEVRHAARLAGNAEVSSLPANYDVVLSPCVLSQLLIGARDALGGSDHPQYPMLREALIAGHLRQMVRLLKPSGIGALAIDVTSTEHFADIATAPDDRVDDLMRTLIADGKCFRVLAPAALGAALKRESSLRNIRFTRAWRWRLGLSKAFLVYGIKFGIHGSHCDSAPREGEVPSECP